jgi:hypothetical protein
MLYGPGELKRLAILAICDVLISWLARKYEFSIQFGLTPNQVRDKLLHCTKAGLARYPAKGKYGAEFSESLWTMNF